MYPPLQNAPLTEWEKRERDGLLALETEEWREKRLLAEDPNTTSDVLRQLVRDIAEVSKISIGKRLEWQKGYLLCEAVAAHPNTPPELLLELFNRSGYSHFRLHLCARGLCLNPIAPLLCLEMPDFWQRINAPAIETLLREPLLPLVAAVQLAASTHMETTSAHFHISIVGNIENVSEGTKQLTDFWRAYCGKEDNKQSKMQRLTDSQWHALLVKADLAPPWASKQINQDALPALPSDTAIAQQSLIKSVQQGWYDRTEFVQFVVNLHGGFDADLLYRRMQSPFWLRCLNAALKLPFTDVPFTQEQWNRSPLDLLNHLAHDGNRLVRWAAQTRLADPDFVFTWQDGD